MSFIHIVKQTSNAYILHLNLFKILKYPRLFVGMWIDELEVSKNMRDERTIKLLGVAEQGEIFNGFCPRTRSRKCLPITHYGIVRARCVY